MLNKTIKIKYLLHLIWYFIVTEIISGVELVIWLQFNDFFQSLKYLENDVFGIRYMLPFTLVVIPIISAIIEYQSKQRKITEALSKLST